MTTHHVYLVYTEMVENRATLTVGGQDLESSLVYLILRGKILKLRNWKAVSYQEIALV